MAGDGITPDLPVPLVAKPAEPPLVPAQPRRPVAHHSRFLVAYLLLGVVVGAAVAVFVVFAVRPGHKASPPWSKWRPSAAGVDGAGQIARYVAPRYRLPSGRQLVAVISRPPVVQNVPVEAIVVSGGPSSNSISAVSAKDSLLYVLCGLGANCSIAEGAPSQERAQLLRREALELALYTFKYVGGTDSVIAFFPPRPGENPRFVLYFRRGDLEAQLGRPVRETLPEDKLKPGGLSKAEGSTIDRLTGPRLFNFQLRQAQDGSALLVLSPPTSA